MTRRQGELMVSDPIHPDAVRWNARYRSGEWQAREPRPLLVEYACLLPQEGWALDAAAGLGSNSLFLAEQGLSVLAIDISMVAMRRVRQRAHERSLPVSTIVADMAAIELPPDVFDVILNFHFLERAAIPTYRRSLRPGGLIFFETFLKTEHGCANEDYYLAPGELLALFGSFEVIFRDEVAHHKGQGKRGKKSERLIARKRSWKPS